MNKENHPLRTIYSFPIRKKIKIEPLIKPRQITLSQLPDWTWSSSLKNTTDTPQVTRQRYSFPMKHAEDK